MVYVLKGQRSLYGYTYLTYDTWPRNFYVTGGGDYRVSDCWIDAFRLMKPFFIERRWPGLPMEKRRGATVL